MGYTYGNIMSADEARGRNTNSIMQGWVDRGPYAYYDQLTAIAGATLSNSYSMFSVPVGAQNPLVAGNVQKTIVNTNMVRGNQFPPPRCLLLFQIGFYFSSSMSKPDIDAVMDAAVIRFKIDEKVFHEGQLWWYPAGAGLAGVSTNNAESVYTNGVPSPLATRRFGEWAKYIAPLQQFSLEVLFPTPPTLSSTGAGLTMTAVLDGLTDRSVQ